MPVFLMCWPDIRARQHLAVLPLLPDRRLTPVRTTGGGLHQHRPASLGRLPACHLLFGVPCGRIHAPVTGGTKCPTRTRPYSRIYAPTVCRDCVHWPRSFTRSCGFVVISPFAGYMCLLGPTYSLHRFLTGRAVWIREAVGPYGRLAGSYY